MSGNGVRVEVTTVPSAVLMQGMRRFFTTVMLAAHNDVARPGRVPIDTGNLRNSLSPGGGVTMVDPSDPPKWAAVGSATGYGLALEAPQARDPHYRDGPSKGQPTAGWLSKTLDNVQPAIDEALAELAASMEAAHRGA